MKKNKYLPLITSILLSGLIIIISSCSEKKAEVKQQEAVAYATEEDEIEKVEVDPLQNKGIGPINSVVLEEIDQSLVDKGREIFDSKCGACHKFDKKYVGPALGGITERRSPEWIMNMILNPVEMTQKDPIAQELLATYYTQMTFQDLTQEETRAVLEYFRSVDKK